MLTDEQIFEIIDGAVSKNLMAEHELLLQSNEAYKEYFAQFLVFDDLLKDNVLLQPSTDFTTNLETQLNLNFVAKKSRQTQYLFIANIIFWLICLVGLTYFIFQNSTATQFKPSVDIHKILNYISWIFYVSSAWFMLFLLDKFLLKPYFLKKLSV